MAARNLLDVAVEAARAAAAVIRQRTPEAASLQWTEKSPADFVTEVDLAAEARVREVVSRLLPHAHITGEELSPHLLDDAPLTFVVDPLDGTANFLHGYPAYAVSIGVLADGQLVAGVVRNVATGEEFTAAAGQGTWRGDERVQVSAIDDPARSLVGTGFPFKHPELIPPYLPQLERMLRATAGVRRAGSAALDLADVACGRFDAFWELHLAPWDVAAGLLLVREAGGIVTDLHGYDAPVGHGPIVAGNPTMHAWLLEQLRQSSAAARGS